MDTDTFRVEFATSDCCQYSITNVYFTLNHNVLRQYVDLNAHFFSKLYIQKTYLAGLGFMH